ncbi:MAG: WG repeat-containing protein [Oscillospiraceae bacterium]|nr:WG repeat-containing protein [Oscillospiraceae bacterium]
MIKKFAFIILSGVLILTAAACNKNTEESDDAYGGEFTQSETIANESEAVTAPTETNNLTVSEAGDDSLIVENKTISYVEIAQVANKNTGICEFSDGLAAAADLKYDEINLSFIDKSGEDIIPTSYSLSYVYFQNFRKLPSFSEGLAAIGIGDDYGYKRGYVDKTGEVVIPFEYTYTRDFSEGLAAVCVGDWENPRWGFIDKKGEIVVPFEYTSVGDFSEGLAAVSTGNRGDSEWGFIDKTGKIVIPLEYNYAHGFSEGLAAVNVGGRWGLGLWGFIDKSGNVVIPIEYYWVGHFSEGLVSVMKSIPSEESWLKLGFIDKSDNLVIPFIYNGDIYIDNGHGTMEDKIPIFSEGLAAVELGGKMGYIDKDGNVVIPFQYDYAHDFAEGLAAVRVGDLHTGKLGYIDKTGMLVVPLEYEQASYWTANSFSDGLVAAKKGDEWFILQIIEGD